MALETDTYARLIALFDDNGTVVPGDRRVDLQSLEALYNGTYVSFASRDIAERLLEAAEIYFNAARLDRSVAVNTKDYVAIAQPRFEPIARGDDL